MRWILLDEVVAIEKGKRARARGRIPEGEFNAEFLLMEMMAQTGGILAGAETHYQQDYIFAKIEQAWFEASKWKPGEGIQIEVSCELIRPEGGWFDGTVRSESQPLLASSRFLLMNVGLLRPETGKPVTFSNNFMQHYQIAEKFR